MNVLTIQDFQKMISLALTRVRARADHFSALDAVTGDGDHGTAIVAALGAVNDAIAKGIEFKTMLDEAGFNVMLATSGSTSTLLGAFFLGMGESAAGVELDAAGVKAMFASGLAGVRKNTKAAVGDKTMMDALIPAVEAMTASPSDDIAAILEAGALAARRGAESTVEMKANFGRARNYGERSIGVADAGASSWAAMFEALAENVKM
jgi:dihydroxyacetone kinase-like protein